MNMKKIFNIITILLLTVFTTSCLDSNLEDLDTYKGKDIIGIAVFIIVIMVLKPFPAVVNNKFCNRP